MTISRRAAKAKGRRLQQWVCQKISELTGFEWGGNDEDRPIQSRPMGQSGTDVRLESQVLEVFPFSVECKAQETWRVDKWVKQAKQNIIPNTMWLLVIKKNREKPLVIMDGDDFFDLLSTWRKK